MEHQQLAFEHLPSMSEAGLLCAARLLWMFPGLPLARVLHRVYPWRHCVYNKQAQQLVAALRQPDDPGTPVLAGEVVIVEGPP